jgi:hypothetical protein
MLTHLYKKGYPSLLCVGLGNLATLQCHLHKRARWLVAALYFRPACRRVVPRRLSLPAVEEGFDADEKGEEVGINTTWVATMRERRRCNRLRA